MATLPSLRALVRKDLHDEESAAYRWTDAVLDRHLLRAARDLGQRSPRERRSTLSTTAGSRELSLASLTDRVTLMAVEYPVGHWPASWQRFEVHGDILLLQGETLPAGAEDVTVYWTGLHTLDGTTSTLPGWAEELVVGGAAGYAALEQLFFTSNKVTVGGKTVTLDLRRLSEARLGHFQAELARLGRSNRVTPLFLYAAG